MLIASWLHFTPPPQIADRAYIMCMARDRLGRRDNHNDRFASPVYLPCITACTLYPLPHSLAVLCRRRPLRTVQMVIVWTALLTDHIASGVTAEKNIARYRYYPIYANIAQFPITKYRYRSNPIFEAHAWSFWLNVPRSRYSQGPTVRVMVRDRFKPEPGE